MIDNGIVYETNSINYILQGFGVFLGVLAGTAITLLTQWFNERRRKVSKLRNLRFEFEMNIKKIDAWLSEINIYRNAVNGDNLKNYYGYFDLSRFVYPTVSEMFLSGLLYDYLSYDEIGKLQVITAEFSLGWEKTINDQIAQNKVKANSAEWTTIHKATVVDDVNFWENKFKGHKDTLVNILVSLRGKK